MSSQTDIYTRTSWRRPCQLVPLAIAGTSVELRQWPIVRPVHQRCSNPKPADGFEDSLSICTIRRIGSSRRTLSEAIDCTSLQSPPEIFESGGGPYKANSVRAITSFLAQTRRD
jgi:hypothetical protein